MECRSGCGACCIAPSITTPLPKMPGGKPAGVRCLHLGHDAECELWGDPIRPSVCANFKPEPAFCGADRSAALRILTGLEQTT